MLVRTKAVSIVLMVLDDRAVSPLLNHYHAASLRLSELENDRSPNEIEANFLRLWINSAQEQYEATKLAGKTQEIRDHFPQFNPLTVVDLTLDEEGTKTSNFPPASLPPDAKPFVEPEETPIPDPHSSTINSLEQMRARMETLRAQKTEASQTFGEDPKTDPR